MVSGSTVHVVQLPIRYRCHCNVSSIILFSGGLTNFCYLYAAGPNFFDMVRLCLTVYRFDYLRISGKLFVEWPEKKSKISSHSVDISNARSTAIFLISKGRNPQSCTSRWLKSWSVIYSNMLCRTQIVTLHVPQTYWVFPAQP